MIKKIISLIVTSAILVACTPNAQEQLVVENKEQATPEAEMDPEENQIESDYFLDVEGEGVFKFKVPNDWSFLLAPAFSGGFEHSSVASIHSVDNNTVLAFTVFLFEKEMIAGKNLEEIAEDYAKGAEEFTLQENIEIRPIKLRYLDGYMMGPLKKDVEKMEHSQLQREQMYILTLRPKIDVEWFLTVKVEAYERNVEELQEVLRILEKVEFLPDGESPQWSFVEPDEPEMTIHMPDLGRFKFAVESDWPPYFHIPPKEPRETESYSIIDQPKTPTLSITLTGAETEIFLGIEPHPEGKEYDQTELKKAIESRFEEVKEFILEDEVVFQETSINGMQAYFVGPLSIDQSKALEAGEGSPVPPYQQFYTFRIGFQDALIGLTAYSKSSDPDWLDEVLEVLETMELELYADNENNAAQTIEELKDKEDLSLIESILYERAFKQEIQKLEEEVELLKKKNEMHKESVDYLKSSQFKEKYAKTNLNLFNPGEEVIMITDLAVKESESEEIYRENMETMSDIESKISDFFESKDVSIQNTKTLDIAREFHVQTQDGIWFWFNLMMEMDPQLEKLNIVYEQTNEIKPTEYVDLRVPGKIVYK